MRRKSSKNYKKKIIGIDFFCGCGGATHGMKKAGVKVLAGLDNDPSVKYAYEKNNKGAKFYLTDINNREETIKVIKEVLDGVERDVLIFSACAPCQPFSLHIKNHKRDPRKSLMGRFIDTIGMLPKDKQPSFIIAENVGPMKKRGKCVLKAIKRSLKKLKYYILPERVINATHFGVPQNRKRLIFLAAKNKFLKQSNNLNWDYFYSKYKSYPINVREAIGFLPRVSAGQVNKKDTLHVTQALSKKNLRRIEAITFDGGSRDMWDKKDGLECYKHHAGHGDVYGRMKWDKAAPTLTCRCISISNGRFGHPEQNRAITLREAAILQTLNNYKFEEPIIKTRVARQIGNAVSPKLLQKLTKFLIEQIN